MHRDSTPVREQIIGGPLLRPLPIPVSTDTAREHIREAMWLLRRLSQSLNAYASDDAFDRPNAADLACEELSLALEKLA